MNSNADRADRKRPLRADGPDRSQGRARRLNSGRLIAIAATIGCASALATQVHIPSAKERTPAPARTLSAAEQARWDAFSKRAGSTALNQLDRTALRALINNVPQQPSSHHGVAGLDAPVPPAGHFFVLDPSVQSARVELLMAQTPADRNFDIEGPGETHWRLPATCRPAVPEGTQCTIKVGAANAEHTAQGLYRLRAPGARFAITVVSTKAATTPFVEIHRRQTVGARSAVCVRTSIGAALVDVHVDAQYVSAPRRGTTAIAPEFRDTGGLATAGADRLANDGNYCSWIDDEVGQAEQWLVVRTWSEPDRAWTTLRGTTAESEADTQRTEANAYRSPMSRVRLFWLAWQGKSSKTPQ